MDEALREWSLKQVADMQAATSQVQKGEETGKEAMEEEEEEGEEDEDEDEEEEEEEEKEDC